MSSPFFSSSSHHSPSTGHLESSEKPVLTVQAHIFQIDPVTKTSWKPMCDKALPVQFYYHSVNNTYRIISVDGTKVRGLCMRGGVGVGGGSMRQRMCVPMCACYWRGLGNQARPKGLQDSQYYIPSHRRTVLLTSRLTSKSCHLDPCC